MSHRRRALTRSLVLASLCAVLVVPPQQVQAGSGLNSKIWGDAGYTVSSSSPYRYSNMTGFAQALVNSLGDTCSLSVDGDYGSLTTWNVANMQNLLLGANNGGIMNPYSWSAFYYANAYQQPYDALVEDPTIDAYGTQYYHYYTGGGESAKLGWNPFASQWLFSQYRSNPSALVQATPSRTISAACD